MAQPRMDREELEKRLVYTLFGPAVELAVRFGMPLAWMKRALETAYFQRARQQDMSLREICELMDISISKAALLSKQLKEGFLNEQEEERVELTQRIEYMLCAGPLTLPRLNQVLPQERFTDVEQALEDLIKAGKVERIERAGMYPRYSLILSKQEGDTWRGTIGRLRRLQSMLQPIMPSIYTRFIDAQSERATHHIVRLNPAHLQRLQQSLDEALFELLDEMDEGQSEESVEVRIAAFWHHDID